MKSPQPPLPAGQPKPVNPVLLLTDYIEVVLNKQEGLLWVRWLRQANSSEYRYGIKSTGEFLLKYRLGRLLVNNQRLGLLTMDDQGWLTRYAVEVISKSSLQKLAIVSSTDTLQQLTNETLDSKVKEESPLFDTCYFLSEQDAMEWLKDNTGAR